MRRLREAGIVTLLLLGLTGCAGVQQRFGRTEPPYLGEEDRDHEGPLSRLAFWRRPHADEASPSASGRVQADPGRAVIAGGITPDDDEVDRPGFLRRMPLVGRIFRHDDRHDPEPMDYPAARRVPASVGTMTANSPARTSPADRPTARPSPAPGAVGDAPASQPASELSVDLVGVKPQVDPAAVPAASTTPDSPPPPSALPGSPTPTAPTPDAAPQQGATPPPPTIPLPPSPSATPVNAPEATPDLTPTTNRGPALPSPTVGTGQPVKEESWTPSVTSTPGPAWPTTVTSSSFVGSGQEVITTSPQSSYDSGGCESSCGPKCKTHKLCPLKKHKQKAAYTTVYASAQGGVSSCEAPCKVKKDCFLKKWLHHKSGCKSKSCTGCKSCTYCGEPAAMVSEQGMVSSQL